MDVKYIWIKKYKNLENIDFNFEHASSEKFQFINGELKITETDSKTPKEFFGKNIKGLTAIVGKNGAGKTNLIEFLNLNLAHVTNGGLTTFMKGQGIIVLNKVIFVQENIEIKNFEELKIKGYKISKFENAPLDISQGELRWHEMEKNKYIYYNPNLDFRTSPMRSGSSNIVNISTSYLVNNDFYNSSKHKKTYKSGLKNTDLLLAYYRNEKLRESDVILNYQPINDFIKFPSQIKLSIDHETENQLLESKTSYSDDLDEEAKSRNGNYAELNELDFGFDSFSFKEYLKETGEDSVNDIYKIPSEKRREGFQKQFLISFFKIYIFLNKESFPEDFLRKFIFDLEFELKNKELIQDLNQLKKSLNKVLELVNWTEGIFGIAKEEYSSFKERELSIFNLYRDIEVSIGSKQNKKILEDLILITKKLLKGQLNFHYEIPHELSSGEQNLLNFYARFYWAKEEIIKGEKSDYGINGERVVIFIDEGEIALHPEWQRQFLKLATQFLSQLFKDREIQLILTTHSPFVLSDIPKENVIFMKRNEETGNAEIADLGREKTFGANIYSLLSDSFFMENGTIGEFAKEKVEWVIEKLDNKKIDLTEEDATKIDYIINAIGEPLIKMQLESMREQRLNLTEVSVMRKRIEELEKEIKKQND